MKIKMNNKGFTLIELLIVVAIIAILAAIAIPQFSAYRLRAFNGAAQSDARNAKTLEEAVFAEYRGYGCGIMGVGLNLNALGAPAAGTILIGPLTPAIGGGLAGVNSAAFVTRFAAGGAAALDTNIGMGLAVSNNVRIIADASPISDVIGTGYQFFMMHAKHTDGNRAFATNTSPAVCFAERTDATWIGVPMTVGVPMTFIIDATTPCTGQAANGLPIATWTAM